jgi:hypothetical protein
MARVTDARTFSAPPDAIRSVIDRDLESFVGAGGFDSVIVSGETIDVVRDLGLATLQLTVRIDRDTDVFLAYEAVDGIFDRMRTEYSIESAGDDTRVTAQTEFALGGIFGQALDATLVSTQRKREFEDQFDYLESQLEADGIVSQPLE